ncbi:MAG TPA: orotidine-5'-phosphate decarboxylase [Dehalococcoidia bacterium]|nr:orotidine-5'-phosphate decarboxylase [Dehalococcoidia bacterium]
MKFVEKLTRAMQTNDSLLCVGLDTDPKRMPEGISIVDFNRAIIRATSDLVCAYKPNLAFYEAMGDEGWSALKETVKNIPDNIPVIADAKRGDIGNTATAYARAIFDNLGFDATTVNPYLGFDAVEPFLSYEERGVIILCRTSNAGATDFQDLLCQYGDGYRPLYEIVALKASQWNIHGNIGLVIGATYPEELSIIRRQHPEIPFLVPGVGAQGGDLAQAVRHGIDANGRGMIINSSRQILYASTGNDFNSAARQAATELRDEINRHRSGLA